MPEVKTRQSIYSSLAMLLEYPRGDYLGKAKAVQRLFADNAPASESFQAFLDSIHALSDTQIEELYTRTFDMAPVCNPYITSYIFGEENFQRGELMSQLAQRYYDIDFPTAGELPDHIGVLLRFTAHCSREEFGELFEFCLSKPIEQMATNLEAAENPYAKLLRSIQSLLRSDFPEVA